MPDYEESLGDQNTFDGGEQSSDRADQSLGDEATFGGNAGYVDDAIAWGKNSQLTFKSR